MVLTQKVRKGCHSSRALETLRNVEGKARINVGGKVKKPTDETLYLTVNSQSSSQTGGSTFSTGYSGEGNELPKMALKMLSTAPKALRKQSDGLAVFRYVGRARTH